MHINRVIQQPGHTSCYGCVAAMVTGEPFSAVADFVGHDGSQRIFTQTEIASYLWDRGYYFESSGSFVCVEPGTKTEISKRAVKCGPYLSDLMFGIACALGRNKYVELRERFDTVVRDFIQEHMVDLGEDPDEERDDFPESNIAAGIKGRDGFQLRHEIRKILFIQSFVDPRQPAIVTAVFRGDVHALYWDGERLFDPHYPHDVDIINYHTFLSWRPVVKFEKQNHAEKGVDS